MELVFVYGLDMCLTEATNDVRCLILQDTVHKPRVPRWCLHRLRRGGAREDELRLNYKSVGLLSAIFRIFSCYCRVSMRWSPVGARKRAPSLLRAYTQHVFMHIKVAAFRIFTTDTEYSTKQGSVRVWYTSNTINTYFFLN